MIVKDYTLNPLSHSHNLVNWGVILAAFLNEVELLGLSRSWPLSDLFLREEWYPLPDLLAYLCLNVKSLWIRYNESAGWSKTNYYYHFLCIHTNGLMRQSRAPRGVPSTWGCHVYRILTSLLDRKHINRIRYMPGEPPRRVFILRGQIVTPL